MGLYYLQKVKLAQKIWIWDLVLISEVKAYHKSLNKKWVLFKVKKDVNSNIATFKA